MEVSSSTHVLNKLALAYRMMIGLRPNPRRARFSAPTLGQPLCVDLSMVHVAAQAGVCLDDPFHDSRAPSISLATAWREGEKRRLWDRDLRAVLL
jgi:hypothetical protein